MAVLLRGPKGERVIPDNTEYRFLPGERLVGVANISRDYVELEQLAHDNKIGIGDMTAKIFETTGFKDWWDEKHGGECAPCKKRQATLNYIKFQGPKWLSNWVKGDK